MDQEILNYQLSKDTIFFTDTIKKDSPYVAEIPREHESLFLVTNSTLLYEKDGEQKRISKGQIGYIARGSIDKSSAYLCDEVSYIAVNFNFDKEHSDPQKTLPFETCCSQGLIYKYEQLFQDGLQYYLFKTPGHLTLCNGILMQIIGLLYNEHTIDMIQFKKNKRIERAIHYLNQHYHSPELKISHLAATVNMSEKNFRRIFQEVYHRTPYAFLQEFRLNKAEILLLNTSKNISDIALQCGFCDVYSFSHCFKNYFGISPTKYRLSQT